VSKSLRKSLNLDIVDLAEMLRSKGRGRDTVLAHITPKEAALLKARGGRGSTNPHTGLPEYEDDFSFDFSGGGADYTPSSDPTPTNDPAPSYAPAPTQDYSAPSYEPAAPEQPVDQGGGGGAPQVDQFSQGGDVGPNGGPPVETPAYSEQQFQQAAAGGTPQYDEAQMQQAIAGELPSGTGDYGTSTPDNTIKDLFDKYGSNILKLLGPAALAAFGAKTGTTAAQQGQAGADKVAAIGPAVQARAADAQQQMIGPGGLASQAQQFGKQASDQIGAVAPQLQQVGKNIAAYGQPLVDIGSNQMQMALSGGLTPANQQAFEAMKAQSEQGIAKRGGVGVMQAGRAEMDALASLAEKQFAQGQSAYQAGAAYGVQGQSLQAEAARLGLSQAQVELVQNNLSGTIRQNAINLGLQQAGISDQYLIQSIQMGLASDQQTSANLQNLYSKMAQIAFSQPTTTTTTTRPA
jgi:hypothetical protein